jgi:hypothetical protein
MNPANDLKISRHPKLGVVIYDPRAQLGIGPDAVRLFKVASRRSGTFRREIVFRDLEACVADSLADEQPIVNAYSEARSTRRKPYCPRCRRHIGSVDAGLCADCHGLKCTCGACECVASGRRKRAA